MALPDKESSSLELAQEDMDAQAWFQKGLHAFRSLHQYAEAAEAFSRALECRMEELNVENPADSKVAEYCLWYGDALLKTEELRSDLFPFLKGNLFEKTDVAVAENHLSENDNEQGDVSNEQDKQLSDSSNEEKYFNKSTNEIQTNSDISDVNSIVQSEKEHTIMHENQSDSNEVKSDTDPDASGTAVEVISDEQLAFEMLEFACKGYMEKIENTEKKNAPVCPSDALDLSFAHIRLGDIQFMNDQFLEASQDYSLAVEIREKFQISKAKIISPRLALGQALMFSGEQQKALDIFQETFKIIQDVLKNFQMYTDPDLADETVLRQTSEDLEIQINDLQVKLQNTSPTSQPKKGSQTEAKECISTTTSYFDESQLNAEPIKINLTDVSKDSTSKRRRINLNSENSQKSTPVETQSTLL